MTRKPKRFGKFDRPIKKLVKVPPAEVDLRAEIRRYEESLARIESRDDDEVDPTEYARIFDRLVRLRKKWEASK